MKNIGYLITGYMVVWGGLFLYLWRIWILQRGLLVRIAILEENKVYPEKNKDGDNE